MTGVQTCALPICFPVTIYHIVEDKRELEHLSDEDLDKALEEAAANTKH